MIGPTIRATELPGDRSAMRVVGSLGYYARGSI
jgi:hypothetical protein